MFVKDILVLRVPQGLRVYRGFWFSPSFQVPSVYRVEGVGFRD